jgi:hypothetical protein
MICDADAVTEPELKRLRVRRKRYERMSIGYQTTPTINMIIGDWYVDELSMLTREVTASE